MNDVEPNDIRTQLLSVVVVLETQVSSRVVSRLELASLGLGLESLIELLY